MSTLDPMMPEDVSAYLNEKIDSGEWWVIVNSLELMKIVEGRHYMGDDNTWFEVIIGSSHNPGFLVALARKSEMSAEQLAACCIEAGHEGISRDELVRRFENQDILFPSSSDLEAIFAQRVFAEMVTR